MMAKTNLSATLALLLALAAVGIAGGKNHHHHHKYDQKPTGRAFYPIPTQSSAYPTTSSMPTPTGAYPSSSPTPSPDYASSGSILVPPTWTPNANAKFIPMVGFYPKEDIENGRATEDITYFFDDPANSHPTDRRCALEWFAEEKGVNEKAATDSKAFNFPWPGNCTAVYDKPKLDGGIKEFAALTYTPYYTCVLFCLDLEPDDAPLHCPYKY